MSPGRGPQAASATPPIPAPKILRRCIIFEFVSVLIAAVFDLDRASYLFRDQFQAHDAIGASQVKQPMREDRRCPAR